MDPSALSVLIFKMYIILFLAFICDKIVRKREKWLKNKNMFEIYTLLKCITVSVIYFIF